jgi:acetyl esterase/lipase
MEQSHLNTFSRLWHRFCFSCFLSFLFLAVASGQQPSILLWPNGAPGSEGKTAEEKIRVNEQGDHIFSNIHHPSITPYLPPREISSGAAVIVIPGGGHKELWMDHEGFRVAKWLSDHGTAAFLLKYRLAREEGSTYTVEGNELADLQRAIRLVRSRATDLVFPPAVNWPPWPPLAMTPASPLRPSSSSARVRNLRSRLSSTLLSRAI